MSLPLKSPPARYRRRETIRDTVVQPPRSEFDTSVARELVAYELGGTVELTHRPEGSAAFCIVREAWCEIRLHSVTAGRTAT